jgi:hypothetical protein
MIINIALHKILTKEVWEFDFQLQFQDYITAVSHSVSPDIYSRFCSVSPSENSPLIFVH